MVYKNADLHIHSRFSDGLLQIEEIFQLAKRLKIRCISITDHDTVKHIPPSLLQADIFGIEFIPGIEITATQYGKDIHILAYFIDPFNSQLNEEMDSMRGLRIQRMERMLANLASMGLPVDADRFFQFVGEGTVGRLQLSDYLCSTGIAENTQDSFDRFIGTESPAYVEIDGLSPEEAIQLIHSAKGLSVLAHPGTTDVDQFIPNFVELGMDGIEVYHSSHTPDQIRKYEQVATRHGLLKTGGSDCHGRNREKLLLGQYGIDYSLVESMKSVCVN